MKKRLLLIIGIIIIIFVSYFFVEPKYIKVMDILNDNELKLKEGDSTGKLKIVEVQFTKVVINYDGSVRECEYDKQYDFYESWSEFEDGSWLTGGAIPTDIIIFKKAIF